MAETCCFDLTLKNIHLFYIIRVAFLTALPPIFFVSAYKIILGMLIFWDDKNISTNSVQELSVFYTNILNDVVLMLKLCRESKHRL